MLYLNYSKQNENNPDCVPAELYGYKNDQWSSQLHFISKQEIQLPKQKLVDINFGLSFELDRSNTALIITLHPSLANQGVILPGGAIVCHTRYRAPVEIKLISFVDDVTIKPDDIILEGICIEYLSEFSNTILRKTINPVDTRLVYDPDSRSNPEEEARMEELNIDYAIMQWKKGIKDPDILKLYPEGHKIYGDIPFGMFSEENLYKGGGLLAIEEKPLTKEESKE